MVDIGILGVQGAISEHKAIMEKTLKELEINGRIYIIKDRDTLNKIDGLIIPGGESTTISKMIYRLKLLEIIIDRIEDEDLAVMGTCAGCIILAKKIVDPVENLHLISVIDMEVHRNAFGRQRESFEQFVNIKNFEKPFPAVFIRAPIITRTWGNCKILSRIDDSIIMVQQDKLLAMSFHPELTDDTRIHRYFINLIKN
ncbi:MAG: pyridoxal 5'-phosphate synthase glutaminase subunit PdxT [Thermoplasmata archaeon]|nr:MAG: pyridoxal 5'-phosphate synthase glutaminase subunit PdxT [Thermoplasmata archaeon]